MSPKKSIFLLLSIFPIVAFLVLKNAGEGESDLPKLIVRGNSMVPMLKPGTEISWRPGHYEKEQVERGDIVILKNPGGDNKIVKKTFGIPGDKLRVEVKVGHCILYINEGLLKNSADVPYKVNTRGCQMLKLYERDYKGKIPEKAYLVLGDNINGSRDASRFGLISIESFLGKAEI